MTALPSPAELVRPLLRGWLHLATAPLALASAVVLLVLAPQHSLKLAVLVFGLTSVALFSTSAAYHLGLGRFHSSTSRVLRRLDHSNIFLVIAGTYTPLAVALLPRAQAVTLLTIVWGGALLGVSVRVFRPDAPRWVFTPAYIALGWVAVAYMPALVRGGGWTPAALVLAGGLCYTLGAVFYALKRPNPLPRVLGHHELFHALTILAFSAHAVAIYLAVLS